MFWLICVFFWVCAMRRTNRALRDKRLYEAQLHLDTMWLCAGLMLPAFLIDLVINAALFSWLL